MSNRMRLGVLIAAGLVGLFAAGCARLSEKLPFLARLVARPETRPPGTSTAGPAYTQAGRHADPYSGMKPGADEGAAPQPAPMVIAPGGVTYMGDHPRNPQNPYENRLVTNASQHTFTTVGRDFDPDLDGDGKVLLFASTRHNEHPDIYVKSVDGYAMTQLIADPADDIQPRFSPDGERVAFASNRSGNWDVWVVDRDGGNLMQLTRDRTDELAPCWSPDGGQIAYTLWGQRSHQWEIWVLSVNEPGLRRFLAYGMFPDWSPDGKRLAFQRARQRGTRWFSLWTVELADGDVRHPTEIAYDDAAACIAPRWSPDGGHVVYAAVAGTGLAANISAPQTVDARLWVVEVERGTRTRLADLGAAAFNPVWAASGRVYFVSGQAGVENIWSVEPSAGRAERRPLETPYTPGRISAEEER